MPLASLKQPCGEKYILYLLRKIAIYSEYPQIGISNPHFVYLPEIYKYNILEESNFKSLGNFKIYIQEFKHSANIISKINSES